MSEIAVINKTCSYCKSKMTLTMAVFKREVSRGAKDLGLSDERMCWKCPKCGQTSQKGIVVCACGRDALVQGQPGSSTIQNVPTCLEVGTSQWVRGDPNLGGRVGCTGCAKCEICGQPLSTAVFESTGGVDRSDDMEVYTMHYSYAHSKCAKERRKEEERRREEEERKLAARREEEERQRQYRIREGLCFACGRALGFLDKAAGRQRHKQC